MASRKFEVARIRFLWESTALEDGIFTAFEVYLYYSK